MHWSLLLETVFFHPGKDRLNTKSLVSFAKAPSLKVVLVPEVKKTINDYQQQVQKIVDLGETVYGINTGFGYLAHVSIPRQDLQKLQVNLIRSHASGVGEPLERSVARALLLLKAHNLCLGFSGASLECIESMLNLVHHDLIPIIPIKGSVGASGDLAPLAHLSLVLLGEGEVYYQGGIVKTKEAFAHRKLSPYQPKAKEGLALINGTQFMATLGAFAVETAKSLIYSADVIASMSLDAVRGSLKPFDKRIHLVREQEGQRQCAENILNIFQGHDQILKSHIDCKRVQDAYSFRCIPQVHGASRDALHYVDTIINRELNSCTDNPLIFLDGTSLSGGNFHGQPLALALDFLGIALAEIGSISERRIEKLTNPNFSELPAFLAQNSGLNSGFMIPHVTAAALVSENKVLAHPASVDSIPTSADKEDHVSMGPIAARKALQIADNVAYVLAIELLTACQGIDILAPLVPSPTLKIVYDFVRTQSPKVDEDRALYHDIAWFSTWIKEGGLISLLETNGITLI